MFESYDYAPLLKEIASVEGAQTALDRTLAQLHQTRRVVDDREISPDGFRYAQAQLRIILNNLPEEVSCVTVTSEFHKIPDRPSTNMEFELRELQHRIGIVDADRIKGEFVRMEFTVLPPFVPSDLKKESHGSRARELAFDVVETLRLGNSSETHILEVKPWGATGGMASIAFLDAKGFRVPLFSITGMHLYKEQKPLTPYFTEQEYGQFTIIPVDYP